MKKRQFIRFSKVLSIAILSAALMLGGCGVQNAGGMELVINESSEGAITSMDVSKMFTDRDREIDYEESECTVITFNGDSASCDNKAVVIDGSSIIIREKGSYILRGTLTDGSICVNAAEDAKVQLILDGATISQSGTAPIYIKQADKVFVTLAQGSTNTIVNVGAFTVVDDNNIDAAIFSKCDLTLNGTGTLTVNSEEGHGIATKDDLVITGGTYQIKSGDHGISGKDSIRIADGEINITCKEDGLHSGNDEDAEKGYVYIEGGNITVSAEDDGIHGESKVLILGGQIQIQKSYEGIEAAIIEIVGGDTIVTASDDGINATDGSGGEFGFGGFGPGGFGNSQAKDSEVYLRISGGKLTVNAMGDGLDSNGDFYITGGEVYVSGPENAGNGALDYDRTGEITGGSFVAVGASGMAMNFNSATQGSAMITTSSTHSAGEVVELKDESGKVLLSYTPTSRYNSVVVSCSQMKEGGTYTLRIGSETQEITLEQLIYGNSSGMGGFGGMHGPGGQGGKGEPGDRNGQKGDFGGRGEKDFEGRPERPGDMGDAPQWPKDMENKM